MVQPSASPVRMANSTTRALSTGSTPGRPRHTGQVLWLGSAPKLVEQPQKIFVCVSCWAWTSSPMTGWKSVRGMASPEVLSDEGQAAHEVVLALEGPGDSQQLRLVERTAHELYANGQARLREAARQRQAGQSRQVARQRAHVHEVHGQRI